MGPLPTTAMVGLGTIVELVVPANAAEGGRAAE